MNPRTVVKRRCHFCGNEFTKHRSNQIFCCEEHKRLARYFNDIKEYEQAHIKWCAWCGDKFVSDRVTAKYCSDRCRFQAHKAKQCRYCGEVADTKDHFIPRAFLATIRQLKWDSKQVLIPACRECNSTAGDRVFRTLTDKRKYIKEQYRKKYKKLLESPDWQDWELEGIGHSLRSSIVASQNAKRIVEARLRWPRS